MEILALLGLSPQLIINFIIIGTIWNILSVLMTRMLTSVAVKNLSDEERAHLQEWYIKRRDFIRDNNSSKKIVLSFLSGFLPTYLWWLNAVFLWHLFTTPGINGIVKGQVHYDKFCIVQLTKYNTK